MAMRTVTAREANQQFSRLLSDVAAGEEVVITRRGQPVATLAPYRGRPMTPEREAALESLLALGRKGFHLGGIRATRDEMHER
jgi:prevent-host-death family protein